MAPYNFFLLPKVKTEHYGRKFDNEEGITEKIK
jgi:hypothetical protein